MGTNDISGNLIAEYFNVSYWISDTPEFTGLPSETGLLRISVHSLDLLNRPDQPSLHTLATKDIWFIASLSVEGIGNCCMLQAGICGGLEHPKELYVCLKPSTADDLGQLVDQIASVTKSGEPYAENEDENNDMMG
eukprot:Clim_evm101s88 gene=Clim_evmTU101s88